MVYCRHNIPIAQCWYCEEPLFTKLQIICEAVGTNTKFEVVNEKIIIQSLGCNQ